MRWDRVCGFVAHIGAHYEACMKMKLAGLIAGGAQKIASIYEATRHFSPQLTLIQVSLMIIATRNCPAPSPWPQTTSQTRPAIHQSTRQRMAYRGRRSLCSRAPSGAPRPESQSRREHSRKANTKRASSHRHCASQNTTANNPHPPPPKQPHLRGPFLPTLRDYHLCLKRRGAGPSTPTQWP